MISITKRLEWDAAHRVLGHDGHCRFLHGHRYVAEITVSALELDQLGRVVDFSVLKHDAGGWIDRNWDHNILLNPDDPLAQLWRLEWPLSEEIQRQLIVQIFNGQPPFFMPDGLNPTAENIAKCLYEVIANLMSHHGIRVESVRVYETPTSYADYRP